MLIAARSSQDLAGCARATASERSKYVSALAVSGSGDISAISPARPWISPSRHLSLVVHRHFTNAGAKHHRIDRGQHRPSPNVLSTTASALLIPLIALIPEVIIWTA